MDESATPNGNTVLKEEKELVEKMVESAPAVIVSSPSSKISHAEMLWNEFLKNISQQNSSDQRPKYPNPDVPEFYPRRNVQIVCSAGVSHVTGDCGANDTQPVAATSTTTTVIDTLMQQNLNKNDLIMATRLSGRQRYGRRQANSRARPIVVDVPQLRNLARYYWTFYHDPNLAAFQRDPMERMPHTLDFGIDGAATRPLAIMASEESPALQLKSNEKMRLELETKSQQLTHMNNVVKSLLEEIWKMNELLTRSKVKEQGADDINSTIEQYLKSSAELGFHCSDCYTKLRGFVGHVSKQLERKIMKQQAQYKTSFVDCILSVIENSLQTLTQSVRGEDIRKQLRKQDAYTQTNDYFYYCDEPFGSPRGVYLGGGGRADSTQRKRQQMTRVYRNRNYYKYDVSNATAARPNILAREQRTLWRKNSALVVPRGTVTTTAVAADDHTSNNPIQLIHQRFKNLHCRLEGMPEKNLVKFSYIVDGREYSAIASTKKEAQYQCASQVLTSCKD